MCDSFINGLTLSLIDPVISEAGLILVNGFKLSRDFVIFIWSNASEGDILFNGWTETTERWNFGSFSKERLCFTGSNWRVTDCVVSDLFPAKLTPAVVECCVLMLLRIPRDRVPLASLGNERNEVLKRLESMFRSLLANRLFWSLDKYFSDLELSWSLYFRRRRVFKPLRHKANNYFSNGINGIDLPKVVVPQASATTAYTE